MSSPVCTVVATVSSLQLSSNVRKNKEFSSKLKGKTDGVPMQVGRAYVHNTPEGLSYRILSVRLGFPPSRIDLTMAVQMIKGFTQRAERLKQDMGGFTDYRKEGGGCQDKY